MIFLPHTVAACDIMLDICDDEWMFAGDWNVIYPLYHKNATSYEFQTWYGDTKMTFDV